MGDARISALGRIGRLGENSEKKWTSDVDWDKETSKKSRADFAVTWSKDEDSETIGIVSQTLRQVVDPYAKFFPNVLREQGYTQIPSPFSVFFHYFDNITEDILSLKDSEAEKDLEALRRLVSEVADKRQFKVLRSDLSDGVVSYKNLWTVFEPGDRVVFTGLLDEENILVFRNISIMRTPISSIRSRSSWPSNQTQIQAWPIIWNDTTKKFERRLRVLLVNEFFGLQSIVSLPVFPIRFLIEEKRNQLVSTAQDRGRKYARLVQETPSLPPCLFYQGKALLQKDIDYFSPFDPPKLPSTEIKGRVMLDLSNGISFEDTVSDAIESRSRRLPTADIGRDEEDFRDFDTQTEPTHAQALLCPALIWCYHIDTKSGGVFAVGKLKDVEWDTESIERLVLQEDRKNMIKTRIHRHIYRQDSSRADIIAQKGHCLTVLLHGPPGTGKTLTAESVAEWCRRPLLSLNIGSLVSDKQDFEVSLREMFRRCSNWKAVLLLDEADVILEHRSKADYQRNAIVSAFLRVLEYYQGVLFLTTNRVNVIDPAFHSRIQMAIEYRDLTPELRSEIWNNILQSKDLADDARRDIEQSLHTLTQLKLNGREIRNAINYGQDISFQEYGTETMMHIGHLRKAAGEVMNLQRFFDVENHRKNESIRSAFKPDSYAGPMGTWN